MLVNRRCKSCNFMVKFRQREEKRAFLDFIRNKQRKEIGDIMATLPNIVAAVAVGIAPTLYLIYVFLYLLDLAYIIMFRKDILKVTEFLQKYPKYAKPIAKVTSVIGVVVAFFAVDYGAYLRFFVIGIVVLFIIMNRSNEEYLQRLEWHARHNIPYNGN